MDVHGISLSNRVSALLGSAKPWLGGNEPILSTARNASVTSPRFSSRSCHEESCRSLAYLYLAGEIANLSGR